MQNTLFTKRLKDEKVVEKWNTLIEGAAGNGDGLYTNIAEKLESLRVPNITLSRQFIKPERGGIEKEKREFLVVENTKIGNYDIYISTHDYGTQLSVSWYMVVEKDTMMRSFKQNPLSTTLRLPLILLTNMLSFIVRIGSKFSSAFATGANLVGSNYDSIGFAKGFNLFDQEEIGAYTGTVHGVAKQAVEELMKELDLDFSKVDTRTRGFLNIS